jgi:hypothetical protein
MYRVWVGAAVVSGLAIVIAGTVSAQQYQGSSGAQPSIMADPDSPPTKPARQRGQKPSVFEHDPDLDAQDQLSPAQVLQQPIPDAVAMPTGGQHVNAAARGGYATMEPGAVRPAPMARPAVAPHVIACSGIFGPDSSHAKLAMAFRSRNVAFTQVDSSSGAKVMASVLFDKDPKQRLEVWWSKPANRSQTHLIVINGQSDWIAPGELHLGLTLAELERLNGKPFKLTGFDKNKITTAADWDGGQLSTLSGGCKIGISLRANSTSTVGDLPADRAFKSDDSSLRAANPTVSEILIAY